MRPRVYLIAFLISIVLAVVSGIAFRFLEIDHETETAKQAHAALQELLASYPCLEQKEVAEMETLIMDAKKGGIRINNDTTVENITNWDLQSTIFLALQVMGSVGYGNAPPLTTGGRLFCVLYGLFGLPLFVVCAYGIGDQLFDAVDDLRKRFHKNVLPGQPLPTESSGALLIVFAVYFGTGIILFIIIPAAIFYSLEHWTFGECIYCCFITVFTIGYADFVPGEDAPVEYRSWYRLGVGVWIMLSLLWFGGVYATVRQLLKYDEIHKPLQVGDDEKNLPIKKRWKKHFDRQWRKFRGRRQSHQYLHNDAVSPSAAAIDARDQVTQLGVQHLRTRANSNCRPCDSNAVPGRYDARGHHLRPGAGVNLNFDNCISCVNVRK